MKRIIASILLAVIMLTCVVGTLSSCDNKSKVPPELTEIPDGGYDGSEVTITFYHTMGAALTGILTDAIDAFKQLYPNITIQHQSYGNYDALLEQIRTEITAGNQPSLAYCYPDHVAEYNESLVVQPLDIFVQSQINQENALGSETIGYTAEQLEDFIDAYYAEGTSYADGKMYSIALAKSTEVLYYNEEALIAAGVVDENGNAAPPKTWDELEEACRKLKAKFPSDIPLGYDSESNWFITMCEQYGSPYTSATGDHFLFNDKANRDFVNRFRALYQEKLVTTQELSGGYTSALFTGNVKADDKDSAAAKGTRCYMCIGSTGGASYQQPKANKNNANGYDFTVGIAPIPQVDPDNAKVISQGPSLCVFKKHNPQEVIASWLFAKFLTTNVEYQARVSQSNGYVPVMRSVQDDPTYKAFIAKADENPTKFITAYAVKVALSEAENCYTSPAFFGSSDARIQVGYLIQKCFSMEGPAQLPDDQLKAIFDDYVYKCKYAIGQ